MLKASFGPGVPPCSRTHHSWQKKPWGWDLRMVCGYAQGRVSHHFFFTHFFQVLIILLSPLLKHGDVRILVLPTKDLKHIYVLIQCSCGFASYIHQTLSAKDCIWNADRGEWCSFASSLFQCRLGRKSSPHRGQQCRFGEWLEVLIVLGSQ